MAKKELLFSITKKDLEIQTFKSGGPGGQNQNKRDTGVRIIHRDSGAVGEARDSRTQYENRKSAFERLVKSPKFKIWITRKINEIELGKTIEQEVNDWMKDENLKIEVIDENGNWIDEID